MAATGPTWRPAHLAPIWPRSWRSTPRCPSITQASMLKCSGGACLLQRCPPAKPHPKPLKVHFLSFASCFCGPIEKLQLGDVDMVYITHTKKAISYKNTKFFFYGPAVGEIAILPLSRELHLPNNSSKLRLLKTLFV